MFLGIPRSEVYTTNQLFAQRCHEIEVLIGLIRHRITAFACFPVISSYEIGSIQQVWIRTVQAPADALHFRSNHPAPSVIRPTQPSRHRNFEFMQSIQKATSYMPTPALHSEPVQSHLGRPEPVLLVIEFLPESFVDNWLESGFDTLKSFFQDEAHVIFDNRMGSLQRASPRVSVWCLDGLAMLGEANGIQLVGGVCFVENGQIDVET